MRQEKIRGNGKIAFYFCSFVNILDALLICPHDAVHPASERCPEIGRRLAQIRTRDGWWAQVFRLFGYAGTGKTTLARHIADEADGEVKFAAFTGKAASVMRGKGCRGASTIHSLIYRARESGEEVPNFDLGMRPQRRRRN